MEAKATAAARKALEPMELRATAAAAKARAAIGARGRGAGLEAFLAKLVVDFALLLVAQHFVRFADLLELGLRCLFCGRVLVRVPLERELAVRFFELVVVGLAVDAQDLVVVLAHSSSLSLCTLSFSLMTRSLFCFGAATVMGYPLCEKEGSRRSSVIG